MLRKNASRAFDAYVIKDIVGNMLFEAFHSNGIDYEKAVEITSECKVSILEFGFDVSEWNSLLLNLGSKDAIVDSAYDKMRKGIEIVYENLDDYMYHGFIDTDMPLYSMVYDICECVINIVAISRTCTFMTK